jgi:3-oxoacyl-[acyl-carrier protein] reductase
MEAETDVTQMAACYTMLGLLNTRGLSASTSSSFSNILDLNVRPALQLTQALLAGMRNAQFGRIVNVSSLVTRGLPFRTSYAAAKSALESLTRTMAVELARDGITANAVAPGPAAIVFLTGDNTGFVTGQTLIVDGGSSLGMT